MTYFGQQKKKLNEIIKRNSNLGPGSYSPKKQLNKSHSYAPFGSLLKKNNIVKEYNKETLGPGSYNIRSQIIKPSIMHYENENCIIIKINEEGCSQFKSKIQRFSSTAGIQTPGPGSYIFNRTNSKIAQRKRTKSVGAAVNKMKQLYTNQYAKQRKPTLSSDKPQINEQPNKPKQNTKGVLKWSLDKKQRFRTQIKQPFKQQDKSILLDKISMEKKKQQLGHRQSSFFASKSIKSHFDQMIYKTSNPFKVQIRKMLGYQDKAPGPGSYNYSTASLSKQKKPLRFQFFGSTVQRFESQQLKQTTVGPGDYDIEKQNLENKTKKGAKIRSQVKRSTTQAQSQQQNIGPGTYYIQSNINCRPTFNRKYINGAADFGSRQPRFKTQHEGKSQQKSQYISFMAQQDEEKKKKIEQQFNLRRNALKNKQYGVFASQSKRFSDESQKAKNNNSFGFYQVGIDDIGTRVKKQQQYNNQFIQCNLTKPGFLSSVERFKSQVEEQPTHKDCWCLIKEVQKKHIDHLSPSFQSNCRRTQVFDAKIKSPPVGQYSKLNSLIKQSFNSKFIKQNQNKTKKIKIWKDKQA